MAAHESAAALPLAFRVGVTGTRAVPAAARATVRQAVADLLGRICASVEGLAARPAMAAVYTAQTGRIVPSLRIVSPLAEGADRLVAEEAIKLGYALDAILPFEQSEYERDFSASVENFRTLLTHAGGRVLALDGGRGAAEWRSYEAVGRHVVRNCDLVVAIWDPDVPPKGRGGTEDTVLFAVEAGLPVWWIDAAGRRPAALIERPAHFRDFVTAPRGDEARARLDAEIERRLVPALRARSLERMLSGRLVAGLQRLLRIDSDPLSTFLAERERRPTRWRPFDRLMHLAARGAPFRAAEGAPVPAAAPRADDRRWGVIAARARGLAARYADRHRTGGLFVIALAALATMALVAGLALQIAGADAAAAEASVLAALALGSAGLVALVGRVRRWPERWADYRALAELARAQHALGWIGWSLPDADSARASTRATRRAGWVAWYAEAAMRAAPLHADTLVGPRLGVARLEIERLLVAGQATYQFNRRTASAQASRRLADVGHAGFSVAGLALVAGLLIGGSAATVLWLAAVVLSVVAAAALGLRSFAGLDAMVEEAERIECLVELIEARLRAVDAARPLASQELGADLAPLVSQLIDCARRA